MWDEAGSVPGTTQASHSSLMLLLISASPCDREMRLQCTGSDVEKSSVLTFLACLFSVCVSIRMSVCICLSCQCRGEGN